MSKNVGILTGGGDCPGLNQAIRAIVRVLTKQKYNVIGFKKGWKGAIKNETTPIDLINIDELITEGGTCLGSSRTNPYKEDGGVEAIRKTFAAQQLDCLVAIGGEDTLGVANKLHKEGFNVVGLPKTIDNDLDGTDITIGFITAVQIATEAMDRLRTTAKSHERVMIVEIMGRHAGWLTAYSGIAGGADMVLVPEFPKKLSEICDVIAQNKARGKNYSIIAIAEGASFIDDKGNSINSESETPVDSFGHVQLGGIADILSKMVKDKTGRDVRATNLGHTQRGGTPAAMDRVLSTALGIHTANLVLKKDFGKMSALKDGKIQTVTLQEGVGRLKTLTKEFYQLTEMLEG
jgi:phosphofructokinase-like protein